MDFELVKQCKYDSKEFLIIGGPCAVESYTQMNVIAKELKNTGISILRAGTFKPRTSPYSFQGLGKEGVKILNSVGKENSLKTVTEVLDTRDVEFLEQYVDYLQIGTRNMQNYALLKEVGKCRKPIILKRGMNATIEEWLYSAEYILKEGNTRVILCERGIRTFEPWTRNTLDLSAVSLIKTMTGLPIIIDPSHGTGCRGLIEPMCLAGIMAGCDGVMVEVHNTPEEALSDGNQSITTNEFKNIKKKIDEVIRMKKELRYE